MTKTSDSDNDIWRPHVTVACVVADGDRYLMVEEEVSGRLAYNQPAGHLDDFESVSHDPSQPLDSGVLRALWLTRREIADLDGRLRSPMVLMSIDDWLAGQRLPLSVLGNLMPDGGVP
jgi:hypothetical protein